MQAPPGSSEHLRTVAGEVAAGQPRRLRAGAHAGLSPAARKREHRHVPLSHSQTEPPSSCKNAAARLQSAPLRAAPAPREAWQATELEEAKARHDVGTGPFRRGGALASPHGWPRRLGLPSSTPCPGAGSVILRRFTLRRFYSTRISQRAHRPREPAKDLSAALVGIFRGIM